MAVGANNVEVEVVQYATEGFGVLFSCVFESARGERVLSVRTK